MITTSIHYKDSETLLTGVLMYEEGLSRPRPGILVVHGGGGLDDHAKGRANGFARLGYVVFACDMYGDGVAGNRERVMSCINELRGNRTLLCKRAQAGLDVLTSNPAVDGRVAVIGYCFGGMTALEVARGGLDVAGAVSVHGGLSTTQPAQPGQIKMPILVCHGALDPHSPQQDVVAFMDEMRHAMADWQLIVYGGALHGFTHETALGQTPGVKYDARADARSSRAIEQFLSERLHDSH